MPDRVMPFLWFDDQAEEAAAFYTSLIPNSRIVEVARYGEAGPGRPGQAMVVQFELDGRPFSALNGGPAHHFTEAFSISVSCPDQAEVDRLWDALTADGGEEGQCAWLRDRWGLSWQIVPEALPRLMSDPDPRRAGAVVRAMLQMRKIDVAALEAAADAATGHAAPADGAAGGSW